MTTFLDKNGVPKTRESVSGDPSPVQETSAPPGLFSTGAAGSTIVEAPPRVWRTRIKPYVLAALLTLTALFVRLAIGVKSGEPDGLELLFIPIILSAYLGGLGPGLLATALAAFCADYFLLAPIHALSLRLDLASVEWLTMVIGGVLVSGLAESFHRSRHRLQSSLARRERTENELRWKSAFLEAQLDSSNDGLLVVDDQGKKLYQNAQMSALLRIPRDIADDPDDQRQIEFVRHRVKNPDPFVAKIAHLSAHPDEKSHDEIELVDGTVLDRFSHPVVGRDGMRYGRIWTFRDITARRQAEAATRESEERVSRIAATVPGVIYEFRMRPNGTFCFPYAGPAIEKIFGVKPDRLLQDAGPAFQLIHREDLPGLVESILESARALTPWRQEFRVRHTTGGEAWVEGASMPEREADGGTRWHGFLHDITERKLAQESHARLATAVEQAAEAIVITDPAGAIEYVNPAFESVSGYTRGEVLGQNPRVLKSGKHASDFYRQMWDALRQGRVWSGRITNRKKNGALYEEEMTISAVRDSAGKVVNYVAVKRDVTREASLEAQFRQAQKMEAIGQLAGGVAHDFNNILTVIQGNAGMLRDDRMPPAERAECSNEIVLAAERAAGLTRQLLLFSRKQVLQPASLNLNQVISGTIKMLQRVLGEDIVLQSEFAPKLPAILADAGMIEQVLLNLAVNSRDAMPDGGRLVITTTAQTLDENQAGQNAEASPDPTSDLA